MSTLEVLGGIVSAAGFVGALTVTVVIERDWVHGDYWDALDHFYANAERRGLRSVFVLAAVVGAIVAVAG